MNGIPEAGTGVAAKPFPAMRTIGLGQSFGIALSLVLLGTAAVPAQLAASDRAAVAVSPVVGARVPTGTHWITDSGAAVTLGEAIAGRPTVLVFADYTCTTLCGPVLTFVADAVARSGLSPREYRLVVLGLDPKDGPREAAAMKRQRLRDDAPSLFLTADAPTIQRTAQAVGYRFVYDATHDQFAHPAAALVLAADGRVTRVLSGLGISAADVRLALIAAGQGHIGTLGDRILLLCYGIDPATGMYTLSIYRALGFASGATVLMVAAGIGWLSIKRPRCS